MSKRNTLTVHLSLARTWSVCLVNAAVAYLTITGVLLILAPDIAGLIVNGFLSARLVLSVVVVTLFLNMLLTLACAETLFITRRENIVKGLKRNRGRIVKGFLLLSASSLACLPLTIFANIGAAPPVGLPHDSLILLATNYGAGVVASLLLTVPLVWLVASLSGGRIWTGLGRFLSAAALVFLMLTILSTQGLPGLFPASLLIPTLTSLFPQRSVEKAEDNRGKNHFHKSRSVRKTVASILLSILVVSSGAPFNRIPLAFGEESRFSEDRLKELVSKAVAEGWNSRELADAIKSDPGLSMLSSYDLNSIAIERDDSGSVEVNIPLNAAGYAIYRKAGNKTTVYDVYAQTGLSELNVGDRRYVLAGYRSGEETYGPFENLDDALSKESEVKAYANATRITSNTVLKTETRQATRVETRYAIVPTVRVARYEVLKEFDSYEAAQNYLSLYPGLLWTAEVRTVEKQALVYSYRLEPVEETTSYYRALMMSRDGYVAEEVRETVTMLVFEAFLIVTDVPIGYMGTVEIERKEFETMVGSGGLSKGVDARGEYYYYSQDPCVRLYKTGEKQREGEVIAWRIYRRIDTSHYETRKTYQVVAPAGYEEKKISIDELPGYVKGFPSREDAEASKQSVEGMLKNWAESRGMVLKACGVESYGETVSRIETFTREVKQHYVVASFLKPVYDVYELQPYHRVWNETSYEEAWGWVFKGHVDEKPENFDSATWVYSPEVVNWTSKTYLGIFTEWETQVLMSIDPRYVAEKHNTTTITREVSYYNVYNASWKLLYHYYKYVIHPTHEYIANGNISSGTAWAFESLGDASGEISGSTYRSSPSSLRITTGNGRGAWRQTFYYDAGGSGPVLDFWYRLSGGGAVAVKKPDGSAQVFTLGGSSSWARFHRDSGDVFSQAGYYMISFVASENSELFVDDVSVHVGGYGEWVYRGDVENKPENVPPDEKYEAFYRIEDKKFIGTFEENVANQYTTPPYIKEFMKKETVSYTVDLYKLYYLEDGVVRYKAFHWEKQQVPIIVRKEETGAKWYLVESGVEIGVGGLTLVESNVPESIVRLKYNDPVKYRLVPKIIDAGEVLELVCETLDGNLARKYEKEGYKVENTRVSAGSPIRFSIRMLQASVEKNELGMLGKQNTLRVAIANPTQDTLAYWVVLEAENEATVVETPLESWAQGPEAVKRIVSTPVAEPGSWLLPVPPGGAPYSLGFTAWVRRVLEGEYCNYVENSAYWPAGSLDCSFTVKILRNGRLVAKQRVLESFESFDVGRTIARHPFETLTGFLTGFTTVAAITALSLSLPPVTIGLAGLSLTLSPFALVGIAASTASALMIYAQTGSSLEALTVSPLGIILAPVRALTDPTMDDSRRTSIIGAVIGAPLGAFVGQKIALDVVMLRMPSELRSDPQVYSKLYTIEEKHGTVIASTIARSIGKLYPHMNVPDAKGLVNMILGDALASRQDAVYIASMLEWASRMGEDFLRQHAGSMMEWLGSPLLRFKLNPLLQLSPDEALLLSKKVGGDFQNMLRLAEFKLSWEQLSKLGPDTVRVLSFGSEGVEVGVEKNLASQLYPGIQKGTIVEFEFAKGSIVLKGLLTYAEERALGDTKYLVFTFKAEERIPYVFELLKEDLQAIPGKQVEKTFGFNTFSLSNGKLTLDKGTLSMDGAVRLSDGMILRIDDPSIRLMPSQDALDTGVINRIVFQGRISGTSIVVDEEG
ncbi:MAG: hypothetical protein QXO47_10400, partial [Thermoproteota archaeon]